MNRIKKNPLALSLLMNIAVFAGLMLLFHPCYETSDDMYMNEFASGVFGQQENHLVFLNYILSSIILGCYKMFPFLNWYAFFHYGSMFVSFVVITYVLIRTKGETLGLWISAIVLIVFGYQGYVCPQFSKTAGFLIFAGALLVFYAFKCGKKVWQKALLGVLLMVLGAMFRKKILMLCLLMVFAIGVVEFFREFLVNKFSCLKKYIVIFFIFAGTIGCVSLNYIYHDKQYEKDAEWVEYLEWDKNLVKLIDSFFPYYEDDKELYDELGISQADLAYYEAWNVADVEQLSTETLARLVEAKDAYWVSTKTKIAKFWSVFPMAFLKISVFPYCMLLFGLVLLQSKKKNYLAYLLEVAVLFAAYMYMYISGRVLYNRVDVIVWLGAVLTIVYLWEPVAESEILNRKVIKTVFLCSLAGAAISLCAINAEVLRWNYDSTYEEKILVRQNAISEDKEHLYLCTINVIGTGVSRNPFYIGEEGEISNYYALGSWTVNTPITNQVLSNYGVTNPYRDAIDNEKVYIIDIKNPEQTEKYIQENYDQNAYMELSHEIGSYNVYRVVTR